MTMYASGVFVLEINNPYFSSAFTRAALEKRNSDVKTHFYAKNIKSFLQIKSN